MIQRSKNNILVLKPPRFLNILFLSFFSLFSCPKSYCNLLGERISLSTPSASSFISDSGKLVALKILLTDLIKNGHRCLIFTQMSTVLDLLENFLSLCNICYCRLDGSTDLTQRQVLMDRFNSNSKFFLCV